MTQISGGQESGPLMGWSSCHVGLQCTGRTARAVLGLGSMKLSRCRFIPPPDPIPQPNPLRNAGGTVHIRKGGYLRGAGGANYWALLTRKRHMLPHPAQPQHTDHWAPQTRKPHQQEHRPQRPTESSDPTQHAKGRAGDCPGPRKETTRRNVTQGGGGGLLSPLARTLTSHSRGHVATLGPPASERSARSAGHFEVYMLGTPLPAVCHPPPLSPRPSRGPAATCTPPPLV